MIRNAILSCTLCLGLAFVIATAGVIRSAAPTCPGVGWRMPWTRLRAMNAAEHTVARNWHGPVTATYWTRVNAEYCAILR